MSDDLLSWESIADMGLSALLLFALLSRLRGRKSMLVVLGLSGLALAYVAARWLAFLLTADLLLALLVSGLLFSGVLVHDDVRRWLDRTGARLFGRREVDDDAGVASSVVEAVTQMAASKTGALIVLPGDQDIDPEIHGGEVLDGRVTVTLLRSLFDPGSPGHDGAVVIRGGRVASFGVYLPLSEDLDQLEGKGTRHAAALGLSQRTDALCVVVSEERGEISVADGGTLRTVDPQLLLRAIRAHGGATRAIPLPRPRPSRGLLVFQAFLSVVLASVGWLAIVAGGEHSTRRFQVAVEVENVPDDLEVAAVDPATVEVVLSGPLRTLLLTNEEDVHVDLDGQATRAGRRTFSVQLEDVRPPDGLEAIEVRPPRVRLEVRSAPAGQNAAP